MILLILAKPENNTIIGVLVIVNMIYGHDKELQVDGPVGSFYAWMLTFKTWLTSQTLEFSEERIHGMDDLESLMWPWT